MSSKLAAFISTTSHPSTSTSNKCVYDTDEDEIDAMKDPADTFVPGEMIIDQSLYEKFLNVQVNSLQTEGRITLTNWKKASDVMEVFRKGHLLTVQQALYIIEASTGLLAEERNVLDVDAPVTVCGDLHGQFHDLDELLKTKSYPSTANRYLFLGDYVDRGQYSCEVMLTLLSWKIAFPSQVFLLRGNHECRSVSQHYGFERECLTKYGVHVYNRFLHCFQAMPIAAKIHASYGTFLALHGGISPELNTLSDIDGIDRFVEPDATGLLCDLLWSDPAKDNAQAESQSRNEYFLPNDTRGCSYVFSLEAAKTFLQDNNLLAIIRAHELEEKGYNEFHLADEFNGDNETMYPPVVTVFSAPNYCGTHGNQGATLRVHYHKKTIEFSQYDSATKVATYEWQSENLAIVEKLDDLLPYMPRTFFDFVNVSMDIGPAPQVILRKPPKHSEYKGYKNHLPPTGNSMKQDDGWWFRGENRLKKVQKSLPNSTDIKHRSYNDDGWWFRGENRLRKIRKPEGDDEKCVYDTNSTHKRQEPGPSKVVTGQSGAALTNCPSCHHVSKKISALQQRILGSVSRTALPMCRPPRVQPQGNVSISKIKELRKKWESIGKNNKHLKRRPSLDKISGKEAVMTMLSNWESAHFSPEEQCDSPLSPIKESSTSKKNRQPEFSLDEILALKLFFIILDRDGRNRLSSKKFSLLAEEEDGYATPGELSTCIAAIDADEDGVIGPLDFFHFALRCKTRYLDNLQRRSTSSA